MLRIEQLLTQNTNRLYSPIHRNTTMKKFVTALHLVTPSSLASVTCADEEALIEAIRYRRSETAFNKLWNAYRPMILDILKGLFSATELDHYELFQRILIASWASKNITAKDPATQERSFKNWLVEKINHLARVMEEHHTLCRRAEEAYLVADETTPARHLPRRLDEDHLSEVSEVVADEEEALAA
jgi:hypothetical protein